MNKFENSSAEVKGIEKFVSSGQRQELEQKILQDYTASLKPVKPKLTGMVIQSLNEYLLRVFMRSLVPFERG